MDLNNKTNEELITLYEETKTEMEYQDSLSLALKVFLNSYYGAGALKSNPFSNGKITNAAITTAGRMSNMYVTQAVNNKIRELSGLPPVTKFSEIKQVDTDSLYSSLRKLVDLKCKGYNEEEKMEFIQTIIREELKPTIDNTINEIHAHFNTFNKEALKMDQEIVADKFCSIASKRYFANVKMSDGNMLNKDKLKVTGISMIGKSTPPSVKKLLKPILPMVLSGGRDAIIDYIRNKIPEFKSFCISNPAEISKTLSVSSLEYFWATKDNHPANNWKGATKLVKLNDKGKYQTAPINSKAAKVYNELLKEYELDSKYTYIESADKMKMLYLKTPNPITGIHNNVVAYKNEGFLFDIGLNEYVDYDLQWNKEFINKIALITDSLNMNLDYENDEINLDEW